jgi:Zinc-binding dehydrogenase
MGAKSELATLLELVASGHLKPVIDRTFPLAACADTHRYLESGNQYRLAEAAPVHPSHAQSSAKKRTPA